MSKGDGTNVISSGFQLNKTKFDVAIMFYVISRNYKFSHALAVQRAGLFHSAVVLYNCRVYLTYRLELQL